MNIFYVCSPNFLLVNSYYKDILVHHIHFEIIFKRVAYWTDLQFIQELKSQKSIESRRLGESVNKTFFFNVLSVEVKLIT